MHLPKSLSWKTAVAIALLAAALPTFAEKRRAVQHPSTGNPGIPVVVTGTVLDAVTNQPVVFADVRLGSRSDRTDRAGKFKISTTIAGTGTLTVTRSGYRETTQAISGGGTQDFTIRVQPTPTVSLRKADGSTVNLDFESIEFGYVPPFGSYLKGETDDFCKSDGTTVTLGRADFARITGPATSETHSPCCPNSPAQALQKINARLKSGEQTSLYFVDSCLGYSIDFIGRDHVSGNFVYTKFSEISEIIFP